MILPRRRLLQLGLAASATSLAGVPLEALAHGRHHREARHGGHAEGRVRNGAEHRVAHHTPVQAPAQSHPEQHAATPEGIGPRRVRLYNLHTDEKLDAVYWEKGEYVPDALHAVNHVLRDFRTGEIHFMDPSLVDLLAVLTAKVESTSPIHVISGYRSPRTNAMLRSEGGAETGVAKKSLHIQGEAVDLRFADVSLSNLHRAALSLGRGGVGYYPVSDFVHVDVGPVRQWGGV